MPFHVATSLAAKTVDAAREISASLRAADREDLLVLFASRHHADELATVVEMLHAECAPAVLVGCTAESLVCGGQEIEDVPALCAWQGGWRGKVNVTPFHLTWERTSEGNSILGWPDALLHANPQRSLVLLLGDPFSFPVEHFLHLLGEQSPGLPVVGGMASAAREAGDNRLVWLHNVVDHGAVGVLLQGDLAVRTLVSQGCRPIGQPLVITQGRQNQIEGLGGKPAFDQLRAIWADASEAERRLMRAGLHVGRVINEYQDAFQRGDFLIRNILGIDQDTGVIAVSDRVRPGQTVQFHVRDAQTADEDLRLMLTALTAEGFRPAGGWLFTCNGRGQHLFGTPHHDAGLLQQVAPQLPVAGFFAMGELGPVGGQNFIHGFTASAVLFDDTLSGANS